MPLGRINRDINLPPHRLRPGNITMAGHLKIGQLVANDKGTKYPQGLDYFIVDNAQELFAKTYGEKPTEVDIIFFDDDLVKSCFERYDYYDGKMMIAYGNNEEVWVRDPNNNGWNRRLYSEAPVKGVSVNDDTIFAMRTGKEAIVKHHVLTMRFLMYKVNAFGYWELTTKGSESSIPELLSVIDGVRETAKRLTFLPFKLKVEKVSTPYMDKGEKKTRNYSRLLIEPQLNQAHFEYIAKHLADVYSPSTVGLGKLLDAEALALHYRQQPKQLSSGDSELNEA